MSFNKKRFSIKDLTAHKIKCKKAAQDWLDSDCLILDTETTGLDGNAEIIEISIIDKDFNVLFNTLVKPSCEILPEVTAINNITNQDVEHEKTFDEIYPNLKEILENRLVVMYNSDFDTRILNQTIELYDLQKIPFERKCAMLLFSRFIDVKRWQKLSTATEHFNIKFTNQHQALSDCEATLKLIKSIADYTD
ncbi:MULTISPECIES: 3'-5' exonuclease [Pseudomonas fluorescens group]|uniref:3'-5' exonuclease n=1 Tax=Pseudomonas gessardii TaxID=78544 RepID=A0ABS9FDZ3_9PSED|nr:MULTISPECIES: 3'-5' exonuclease [Pseudomonas fluorescens group]MCF5110550.1 3'-5' exonuclease [Pseudomonas gessardii]WJM91617.1 3'-5' exonuclease [Pseudomonas brenneri]